MVTKQNWQELVEAYVLEFDNDNPLHFLVKPSIAPVRDDLIQAHRQSTVFSHEHGSSECCQLHNKPELKGHELDDRK